MPTNHNNKPANYPSPSDDIVDYPTPAEESKSAGYEMTDVNAGGIAVFVGGLFGFVIIFFFFCYFMGRAINSGLNRADGPTDKWHQGQQIFGGSGDVMVGAKLPTHKREDLKSNALMEQQEFAAMARSFPQPQLQTDDGNNDTAELHEREDVLLDHYSNGPGQPTRIPIERAMQLIASKGLPVSQGTRPATMLAGDEAPLVTAPLTNGFARTGYELDQIEARHQRLEFQGAEAKK